MFPFSCQISRNVDQYNAFDTSKHKHSTLNRRASYTLLTLCIFQKNLTKVYCIRIVIPWTEQLDFLSFSTHFFLSYNNPLTGILLYLLAQKVTHQTPNPRGKRVQHNTPKNLHSKEGITTMVRCRRPSTEFSAPGNFKCIQLRKCGGLGGYSLPFCANIKE